MDTRKWWIFVAIALATMMVDVDITAANLALASIARDLHITLSTAQWIIDGYMIAAASLMALGGKLADALGPKRVFLSGLTLFTVSTLAVALSIGPWSIMLSRISQGACIAFTFPVGIIILRHTFPKEQVGFAVGLMVAIAGLSMALGPTLGGMIIHWLSWRWIFFVTVPVGLIALSLTVLLLPKDPPPSEKLSLNLPGLVTLVLGLFALMTALNEVQNWGVDSLRFIFLLLSGFALLGLFVYFEVSAKNPLLELRVLMNRNLLLLNPMRICFNFIYFSLLFTLSLLLQNILHYSSLHAGYMLLAMTLVFGVLSIPAGRVIDRVGPRIMLQIGFFIFAISCLLLGSFAKDLTPPVLLISFMIAGIAIAMIAPASGIMVLFSVKPQKAGAATGILFTNGFIGSGLGIAISGWMLAHFSRAKLATMLGSLSIGLDPSQWDRLTQIAAGAHGLRHNTDLFSTTLFHLIDPVIRTAFTHAFSIVMFFCTALAIFAFLLSLNLKLPTPTE